MCSNIKNVFIMVKDTQHGTDRFNRFAVHGSPALSALQPSHRPPQSFIITPTETASPLHTNFSSASPHLPGNHHSLCLYDFI